MVAEGVTDERRDEVAQQRTRDAGEKPTQADDQAGEVRRSARAGLVVRLGSTSALVLSIVAEGQVRMLDNAAGGGQ